MAAQADHARPRLVVGIVVDQLRTDYIEYLQYCFGERGFKTLLGDGVYMRDVDFKVPRLDATNATAMVLTGAYPSETGVSAAAVYDRESLAGGTKLPLVVASTANLTNDSFSPAALRLSTVADELAINSEGSSTIYSVAMDPQQAVLLAGHSGTGAFWVNNTSGNWATTSYYGALPSLISNRNFRGSLAQRIDTMVWKPSAKLVQTGFMSENKRISPFKYTFPRADRDVYKRFAVSPLANREVTDVAIDLLRNLNLGTKPGETDMLNIAYTVAPYKYAASSSAIAEVADAYLKLDGQLARLIEAVDRCVGRQNAVIWLTSTGYYDDAVAIEEKYRVPGGEFSTRRAKSLLNSYLSARFGSGSYVSIIRDGQVYFDHHTIELMHLDAEQVVRDARSFLVKMSGVADAATIDEIISATTPERERLRMVLDPRDCGDIVVRFDAGWAVVYDEQMPSVTKYTRETPVMTPAFLLAPGIPAQTISSPVDATAIAPTVAGALRIRSPNGARSRAIPLSKF